MICQNDVEDIHHVNYAMGKNHYTKHEWQHMR